MYIIYMHPTPETTTHQNTASYRKNVGSRAWKQAQQERRSNFTNPIRVTRYDDGTYGAQCCGFLFASKREAIKHIFRKNMESCV